MLNNLYIFITKIIFRCKIFFNAYPQPYKCLIHIILQSFAEGQKFVRGDRQGTAFLQRNQ